MADVALATNPLLTLFAATPVEGAAAVPVVGGEANPFAALLATVTPTTMPATPSAQGIVPAATTPLAPALAMPNEATALPVITDEAGADSLGGDAGEDLLSGDPLGDAIAAGATAVLAFAPLVAPTPAAAPAPLSNVQTVAIEPTPRSGSPASVSSLSTLTARKTALLTGTVPLPVQPRTSALPAAATAPAPEVPSDAGAPLVPAVVPVASPEHPDAAIGSQGKLVDVAPFRNEAGATPVNVADAKAAPLPDAVRAALAGVSQETPAKAVADATVEMAVAPAPVASPDAPAILPPVVEGQPSIPPDPAPNAPARPEQAVVTAPATIAQLSHGAAKGIKVTTDAKADARTETVETRRRGDASPPEPAAIGLTQRAAEPTRPMDPNQPGAVSDLSAIASDVGIEQQLVVARDGVWLDRLARDIAHAASGSDLHFRLSPPHLGDLAVAIAQKDDGASIRLIADNDTTRDLLIDNQPKLVAEARAQGLKISDTQVDVRQQDNGSSGQSRWDESQRQQQGQPQAQAQGHAQSQSQSGQDRQSSTAHKPFARNAGIEAEIESAAAGDPDALYA